MIIKPNVSKFGGFLLAIASVVVAYIALTTKATPEKISDPISPIVQEITSKNITVKLIGAHTEASGYRVELCYNLPDQRDWLLTYPNGSQSTILP